MLPAISDWINLEENDFLKLIQQTAAKTGQVADVFRSMVAYNVPNFVLKNIWVERWQEELKAPALLAFCVAEDEWQGKIDNIKSNVIRIGEKYILTFAKSYVIEADALIILVRYEDDFALARVKVNFDDPGQDWQSRGEADIQFKDSDGNRYDHYRVEGELALAEQFFHKITRKEYARLGLQIPRREYTSLAVVASGVMQHHQIYDDRLDAQVDQIMAERSSGRIKESMQAATTIFEALMKNAGDKGIELHPFWLRAEKLFSKLKK